MEKFSTKKVMDNGKLLGYLILGMIGGNLFMKLDKKGGLMFPALLTGGGLLGSTLMDKSELIKFIALGAGTFGGIKLVNVISKPADQTTTTTQGIFGLSIPESVKTQINKIFPTLADGDVDYTHLSDGMPIDYTNLEDPLILPETQVIQGLRGDIWRQVA